MCFLWQADGERGREEKERSGTKRQYDNNVGPLAGEKEMQMKTLIYGAGTLGCLYAHRLFQAGRDVTLFARGKQHSFIRENGVVLINELTGEQVSSKVRVVDGLAEEDAYDLVVVLIRKNLLPPIIEALSRSPHVRNILFMGNNALGFDQYLSHLPEERVLFGFPGAGGSREEGVVHYVDSEKPNGKRMPITIGERDGRIKDRTKQITSLFESSGVPVNVVADIDGWLKYHVALVSPIANALHMHDCDNYALAKDREGLRLLVSACKEGGNVLKKLGYSKRQPSKWNLFYWMPEFMTAKVLQKLLGSRFAEIAFARHARAGGDEMRCLADEFKTLIDQTSRPTLNIDKLRAFVA
jgi:2-dehydropantoate 2-reductase